MSHAIVSQAMTSNRPTSKLRSFRAHGPSWLSLFGRSSKWGRTLWVAAITCLVAIGPPPAAADYPHTVLDDEPVGFWRFDDAHGQPAINSGTRGADWTGQYLNGIGPGAAGPTELGDGTPVNGLSFSNTALDTGAPGAYVLVEHPILSGLTEFTISGWVNPRELSGSNLGLAGQHDAIAFGFGQESLKLTTAEGGSVEWLFGADQIEPGDWFHTAAVGTGEQLHIYFNGARVQSGGRPITADYGQSDETFRLGGGGIFDGTGNEFRGTIDEFAVWDAALTASQIQSHFDSGLAANAPGDFNGNGQFDVFDVNQLQRAIFEGSTDSSFDLSFDGVVNEDDLVVWVGDIRLTWLGDANLDGEFNSSDFVHVFTAGEYEDGIEDNSGWGEGDWNADLDFDSRDLVDALREGGFENGPLVARPVPEPASVSAAFVLWLLCWAVIRQRERGLPDISHHRSTTF